MSVKKIKLYVPVVYVLKIIYSLGWNLIDFNLILKLILFGTRNEKMANALLDIDIFLILKSIMEIVYFK